MDSIHKSLQVLLGVIRDNPRRAVFGLAVVARAAILAIGQVADKLWEVRYTDVDYDVFTDGARELGAGKAPYGRATFRYPPILALAMLPNLVFFDFGKWLFCAADMITGALVYSLLRTIKQINRQSAALYAAFFLLHPYVINVSTRGNGDGLVTLSVVATLHFLAYGHLLLAAMCYGLAVHLKLYPVVYALPMGLWLLDPALQNRLPRSSEAHTEGDESAASESSVSEPLASPYLASTLSTQSSRDAGVRGLRRRATAGAAAAPAAGVAEVEVQCVCCHLACDAAAAAAAGPTHIASAAA